MANVRRDVNVDFRHEVHSRRRVHEVHVRNLVGRRAGRLDVGNRAHVGTLVHDHARDRMVRIVVLAPMAEDHVGPGDAKGLDEGVPRLHRIQQELVVEARARSIRPRSPWRR